MVISHLSLSRKIELKNERTMRAEPTEQMRAPTMSSIKSIKSINPLLPVSVIFMAGLIGNGLPQAFTIIAAFFAGCLAADVLRGVLRGVSCVVSQLPAVSRSAPAYA